MHPPATEATEVVVAGLEQLQYGSVDGLGGLHSSPSPPKLFCGPSSSQAHLLRPGTECRIWSTLDMDQGHIFFKQLLSIF